MRIMFSVLCVKEYTGACTISSFWTTVALFLANTTGISPNACAAATAIAIPLASTVRTSSAGIFSISIAPSLVGVGICPSAWLVTVLLWSLKENRLLMDVSLIITISLMETYCETMSHEKSPAPRTMNPTPMAKVTINTTKSETAPIIFLIKTIPPLPIFYPL